MSLKRELRTSWGVGRPSRVHFGGQDAAEDSTWEQLGAEEGAVVRAEWIVHKFTNATIKDAVNEYCNPATRDQVVRLLGHLWTIIVHYRCE